MEGGVGLPYQSPVGHEGRATPERGLGRGAISRRAPRPGRPKAGTSVEKSFRAAAAARGGGARRQEGSGGATRGERGRRHRLRPRRPPATSLTGGRVTPERGTWPESHLPSGSRAGSPPSTISRWVTCGGGEGRDDPGSTCGGPAGLERFRRCTFHPPAAPPHRRPPLPGPAVAAARWPFMALGIAEGGGAPRGVDGGVRRGSPGGGEGGGRVVEVPPLYLTLPFAAGIWSLFASEPSPTAVLPLGRAGGEEGVRRRRRGRRRGRRGRG